jgi:hypothetical protein
MNCTPSSAPDAHQRADHSPLESRTRESYRALIADIGDQFQVFVGAGYTMTLWHVDGQPYPDSREMRIDVRRNRHLYIYPTSGVSRDHPLAQPAMPGWCWNDVFRAVHGSRGPPPGSSSVQSVKKMLSDSIIRQPFQGRFSKLYKMV